MKAVFSPSIAKGDICAPPSKSIAHRLMIACALADGQSVIRGISSSDDMLATLSCIRALGAQAVCEKDVVKISPSKRLPLENATFDCYESGSTLRFVLPIILAIGAENCMFKCAQRLVERGVDAYESIFAQNNITMQKQTDRITVCGKLLSGKYTVRGDISSQYITGLLFALSIADGNSVLKVEEPVESRAYIDITLDIMKKCGVKIDECEKNVFSIKGNQTFDHGVYDVEGDWSNAAFLLAFDRIGGNVNVGGLDKNSVQGDKICLKCFDELDKGFATIDVSDCPDLAPILFAVSAIKSGARFTGTRRLKIKESDRANAMASELEKYGVKVDVEENEATVYGGNVLSPKQAISGHNDHRIVMANAVLLSRVGGRLEGIEAVKKSYPDFFEDISKLGVKYEIE